MSYTENTTTNAGGAARPAPQGRGMFARTARFSLEPQEVVAAAREIVREPRLLPYLVLPERLEDIPCVMPASYHRPPGCGAPAGEACRKGEAEACLQRRECFRFVSLIHTRPGMPFACPGCWCVPGQNCLKDVGAERFEPAWNHAHPSRQRIADAVRAAMGGPPIHSPAYAEWVRPDKWRAPWTRALGEAYYVLQYEAGTPGELARARRVVAQHEALPERRFVAPAPSRVAAPAPAAPVPVEPSEPAKPRLRQVTFE